MGKPDFVGQRVMGAGGRERTVGGADSAGSADDRTGSPDAYECTVLCRLQASAKFVRLSTRGHQCLSLIHI